MRKPYPRYKPSGVEWLGEVPEHWGVKRMRYLFRFESGGTPDTGKSEFWEGTVPWVSAKDMRSLIIEDTEDHISEDAVRASATSLVPARTLLILTRSGILRHSLPTAVVAREVAINQDIKGCIPTQDIDPLFVAYLIQGNQSQLLTIWRQQGATVESLDFESIKAASVAFPPQPEQHAITDFLDIQTAKLDTLMAKKRALIEKLQEKRVALISQTVTRGLPPDAARAVGLDPYPRLKPSGIDWRGDVPEQWSITPLGFLVRFRGGATPDKDRPEYWNGLIPWVSPKDMKCARLSDAEDHVSEDALRNSPLSMIQAGAVLVVVRGMILAHSFPVALTDAPLTINQDMKALLPSSLIEPRFLAWALTGTARAIVALADESAHGTRKLETAILAKVPMVVPPLPEQRAIADFIDRETAKIDQMVAKVESIIARLQEYRTALITAAVTGKIDVRDIAA